MGRAQGGNGQVLGMGKRGCSASLSREQLDAKLVEWFAPAKLDADTALHPRSGWPVQVGIGRTVLPPESGQDEGPPLLSLTDYGQCLDRGLPRRRAGTEPIEHAYRAMSAEEWAQAQARGFIQSDGRGTLADWEGTNAGVQPDTAVSYLPQGEGVIVKVAVRAEDGWFTRREDSYIRTRHPVPLDRVQAVSPMFIKDEHSALRLPNGPRTGGQLPVPAGGSSPPVALFARGNAHAPGTESVSIAPVGSA